MTFGIAWPSPRTGPRPMRPPPGGSESGRSRGMRVSSPHMSVPERHRMDRIGWLRAAVLGANDGIVSTASLVVGVAAANVARHEVLLAGIAGMVAGAFSM